MNEFIRKLIARLEKQKNKYQELADSSNFDGWHQEDIEYTSRMEMCEEILEIVNELAMEYDNDFCEWKWGMDTAIVQCKGDRILFGSRRLFSFCPYCGKKIKVVK